MAKYFRGDVVEILWPAGHDASGKPIKKYRPGIVLFNQGHNTDVVTVYCTSKNDGEDKETIFVECKSENGKQMGLTKDSWIRPKNVKTFSIEFIKRKIGTCPLMAEINRLIDDQRTK